MIISTARPTAGRLDSFRDNEPMVLLIEDLEHIQRNILTDDTSEITDVRHQISSLQSKVKSLKNEEFDAELGRIKMLNASKFPFYMSKTVPGIKIPLKEDPKRKGEWVADFSKIYAERKEFQRRLKHLKENVLPELRVSQGIRNIFILENLDTNLAYVVSSVYYETCDELFQQFLYTSYNKEVDAIKRSSKWNTFYVGALAEKVDKGPVFHQILEYLSVKGYETYNIRFKDMSDKIIEASYATEEV